MVVGKCPTNELRAAANAKGCEMNSQKDFRPAAQAADCRPLIAAAQFGA
jgi:hypothetical protein